MIELYMAGTANGQRASIMLEECGVPYRVHKVDLAKGEQKQEAFLAMNAAGAIPVMVDPEGPGGKSITLSQSTAILLYLCEKSGRHLPADPAQRYAAMVWLMRAATDVAPTSGAIFQLMNYVPEKSAQNTEFFENRLINFLRVADQQLATRDYLLGEICAADLSLYPVVMARRALAERGGLNTLLAWTQRVGARPAVQRGMAQPG